MLTVEVLKRRLDWDLVDEEINAEHRLVYLFVRPTTATLEPVYICLDEERSSIVQFGFGEWHYHPDELEDAINTATLLVRGERCVVEQCNAAGKYQSGGLHDACGLPGTLGTKIKSLRRLFFDQEPVCEKIDFNQYFRGKHLWISHDHKAETEKIFRELGLAMPDW